MADLRTITLTNAITTTPCIVFVAHMNVLSVADYNGSMCVEVCLTSGHKILVEQSLRVIRDKVEALNKS